MSSPPLVLLKLGGSLITEKDSRRVVRRELLRALAREIGKAVRDGHRLIVGHGSGSFGHPEAAAAGLDEGIDGRNQLPGVVQTQEAARELHREVLGALSDAGAPPFSLLPGSLLVTESGVPANLFPEPVLLALSIKLLPVLCGDVVLDRDRGVSICSTESVLLALANRLVMDREPIARAVWLGTTDGVYDADGRTVPELDRSRWEAMEASRSTEGIDVTGGIVLRVETALLLADLGIPSVICDGREPEHLLPALAGEPVGGTLVPETTS